MSYLIKQTYKMGKVKELNVKNRTHYFFDNMINIKNFHSDLLKIDKKPYKDLVIFIVLVTSRLKKLAIVKIFAALIPCI